MIRQRWNENWKVSDSSNSPLREMLTGVASEDSTVTLPHDAMIHEKRSKDTKNAHQTGFYPGGVYNYTKKFMVPEEWKNKTVSFEFEGVYMNSRVYINGDFAGGYPGGYTNYYVCADDFLKYGEENEIKVIANNSTELNSRWYSGSGIYRNVQIMVSEYVHIKMDGLRVTTHEVTDDIAVIQIDAEIESLEKCRHKLNVQAEIRDSEGNVAASDVVPATLFGSTQLTCRQRIMLRNPKLWDVRTPNLYSVSVKLVEEDRVYDEAVSRFGIRTLSLNSYQGLLINGKEVKLRGACIHHDNGVIGACTLERAEERRVQQLKAAGFNCIRSAHHPMSKAMLDACDREGMFVLDELSDIWTRSKNHNDASQFFTDHWEFDVEQMVAKDYNHPSVIMYITGNEIQEAGTAKGAELNRIITNKIRSCDDTRYTTSAINGLFAGMDKMGEIMSDITGMSQEQLAQQMAAQLNSDVEEATDSSVGADAANSMQNMLKGPMADALACNQILSDMIEEFSTATDIVGLNYLTARHVMENKINSNRIVLGTETFPEDIENLWKIVEENHHVIGDMTWTGYDYLGEAGIGIFYYDGRQGFTENWPSSVAYIGDIDIIGYRRPISYYREIVFGLRKEPYIAVERVDKYGQTPNMTPWMWKDNIASWTWKGHEGKPTKIDVLSVNEEVELFINGRSLGRKPSGRDNHFMASYEIPYEPGILKAVGYENGIETGWHELVSADEGKKIVVDADRSELKANGSDLSYLLIGIADDNGNTNMQESKEVSIEVMGAGTLQGFGSADPETQNSYDNTTWATYDGFLLAVIRAGNEAGVIHVKLTSEGCQEQRLDIVVK